MLTVTDNAKQYLKNILLARTDDPDFGVRLTVEASGQLGLRLGREAPGDHVVEYEGSKVLLVGQEVAQQVAGRTLDTGDTPEGTRLTIFKER